jgi:hypothetical protein
MAHGSFENITTLLILKYDNIAICASARPWPLQYGCFAFPEQDDAKYYQNQ